MEEALEVVKWFNNHSRALGMFKDTCLERLCKVVALILPVLTRWTSHYLCARRLLELERVFKVLVVVYEKELIECAGARTEARDKAKEVMEILKRTSFWSDLAS